MCKSFKNKGANLGIDANRIQSRSGGAEANITINPLGGDVTLGADTNDTITSKGHIELLETLGEKILSMCFQDDRVLSVWMKLEKLDVFKDTDSVGIEIIRDRTDNLRKKQSSINIEKIKFHIL